MFLYMILYVFCNVCMLSVIYFSCASLQSSCSILNRGESSGCQPQEVLEQVELLKANIADLEMQERELDMQKACLQQSIKHLNEDSSSCRYPYTVSVWARNIYLFIPYSRLIFFHFWVVPHEINSPRNAIVGGVYLITCWTLSFLVLPCLCGVIFGYLCAPSPVFPVSSLLQWNSSMNNPHPTSYSSLD